VSNRLEAKNSRKTQARRKAIKETKQTRRTENLVKKQPRNNPQKPDTHALLVGEGHEQHEQDVEQQIACHHQQLQHRALAQLQRKQSEQIKTTEIDNDTSLDTTIEGGIRAVQGRTASREWADRHRLTR
jgi:hypothetical protein